LRAGFGIDYNRRDTETAAVTLRYKVHGYPGDT